MGMRKWIAIGTLCLLCAATAGGESLPLEARCFQSPERHFIVIDFEVLRDGAFLRFETSCDGNVLIYVNCTRAQSEEARLFYAKSEQSGFD